MNRFVKLPIKRYVIVGSYAMGTRYAKDIDVIAYQKDIDVEVSGNQWIQSFEHDGRKVEILIADEQESLDSILKQFDKSCFAPTSFLYALKRGHITFPHKQWKKHIHDMHNLKSICFGAENFKYIHDLIKLHKKSTEERIGKQKTPKLNGVTKEEFFDDFVKKHYVHDDIHQVMAHKEKPMYSYMQKDPNSVECSKELWNKFTDLEKDQCVMEEMMVIALERHIIPTIMGDRVGMRDHDAIEWALMRVCTNLCSGFFRDHAVDNYFRILNSYNKNYVTKFMDNVKSGAIQTQNGELVQ